MQLPNVTFDVPGFISTPASLIPVAAVSLAGLSFLLFRGRLAGLGLFGPSDSESIMNFSSLGTLRCVCGAEHSDGAVEDRRSFCRSCGCEVVAQDRSKLDKQMSKSEIRAMTRSLRRAAIRASHLELPPSITTVEELHRYLDSSATTSSRNAPPPPPPLQQPQVH